MRREVLVAKNIVGTALGLNSHGIAIMEGLTNCNRQCFHCDVFKRYNPLSFSSFEAAKHQVNGLADKNYAVFNYVGGETLADCPALGALLERTVTLCPNNRWVPTSEVRAKETPFRDKEGMSFVDYTLGLVREGAKRGMITNVTSNADFIKNRYHSFNNEGFLESNILTILREFKEAGLDFLNLSLHSYGEAGLIDIVSKARLVAKAGIIPIVSVVFTKDRTDTIPLYARTCAANGVLFSTALVQEAGGGFSRVQKQSMIPSTEQQKEVFEALLALKKPGFIRTNSKYLTEATKYPGNSWKCNPESDKFIHNRALGEKGEVGVCQEVHTDFDINVDLRNKEWREKKREMVEKCQGCLYGCFYEAENPDFLGDFRTIVNMILIKTGHWGIVKKLGERSVSGFPTIDVPESKLEKEQAELKEYMKFPKRLLRRAENGMAIIKLAWLMGSIV